jgi:hypothetical protein
MANAGRKGKITTNQRWTKKKDEVERRSRKMKYGVRTLLCLFSSSQSSSVLVARYRPPADESG